MSASRHTSTLSTQTFPSFKGRVTRVGRKSQTPCTSGSPSYSSFRAKTSKVKREDFTGVQLSLGFLLDFSVQQNLWFLDQIDRNELLRYVKFLREHDSDLDDRTVHNIFETLNTFLRTRDILIAGKILAELDYRETAEAVSKVRLRRSPPRTDSFRFPQSLFGKSKKE